MWGWVELTYANGFTLVIESGEWGKPYDRKPPRHVSLNDLSEADRKKLAEMPDPEPPRTFADAVKTRQPAAATPRPLTARPASCTWRMSPSASAGRSGSTRPGKLWLETKRPTGWSTSRCAPRASVIMSAGAAAGL